MRRDVQGARHGELSVPRRRWRIRAVDHRCEEQPRRDASDVVVRETGMDAGRVPATESLAGPCPASFVPPLSVS